VSAKEEHPILYGLFRGVFEYFGILVGLWWVNLGWDWTLTFWVTLGSTLFQLGVAFLILGVAALLE